MGQRKWSVISGILLVSGFTLILIWPVVFNSILLLKPNSPLYNLWKKLPVQIENDFYFFNWTNPEDIYNKSVKPRFTETGPYKFWQAEEKQNVIWNNNGTVTYWQNKKWYYDPSNDNGELDDIITTINPMAMAAAAVSRPWNYLVRKGLSLVLSNYYSTCYISRPVRQLLFEGYSEPFIKVATAMPFLHSQKIPAWDRFGWLYTRNNSIEFNGVINMGTGANGDLGRLYSWDYNKQNPYFPPECSSLEGSAGEFLGRNLKKDTITFFVPEMRRTTILKFNRTKTVAGILGYEYIGEDHMLDNGTIYPINKCYCHGQCLPSGVVNISSTRYGVPLFLSLPHFVGADPYYINSVEGMKPDKSKHTLRFIIEPITGIPLEANMAVQANMLLSPVPDVSIFENVPTKMLPAFWMTQKARIPSKEAFLLKIVLNIPVIFKSVGSLFVVISLVILLYLIYEKWVTKQKAYKKENNLNNVENVPLKPEKNVHIIKELVF